MSENETKKTISLWKNSNSEFIARVDRKTGKTQRLAHHANHVSALMALCTDWPEMAHAMNLIGALHDAGKLDPRFCAAIDRAAADPDVSCRAGVNHALAGGLILRDLRRELKKQNILIDPKTVKFLESVMLMHHGLKDLGDIAERKTFTDVQKTLNYTTNPITKEDHASDYKTVSDRFYRETDKESLALELKEADLEYRTAEQRIDDFCQSFCDACGEPDFYIGMMARMMTSALMDADWMDAASCGSDFKTITRKITAQTGPNWESFRGRLEEYLEVISSNAVDSALNRCRAEISLTCGDAAKESGNLFRLSMPTGSGKTLSSLRFALERAVKEQSAHIFYVAPFHSVVEQNAAEIERIMGKENVLVHHSNVVHETEEEDARYQKLTERWDSPVIVTTAVQMLNTLFDGKKACIRRMRSLRNSIIVFDEVQSIPVKCMTLFHLAANFLSEFCHTTVVLCSATQPSVTKTAAINRLAWCADIGSDILQKEDFQTAFRRSELVDLTRNTQYMKANSGMELSEITELLQHCVGTFGDTLMVVNTKPAAEAIYHKFKTYADEAGIRVYYLTTNMCAAHRQRIFEKIREALASESKERLVCISTQLIEAGVDLSFDCAIRSLAGLDRIVQTAGRCNRHGLAKTVQPVYIVKLASTVENVGLMPELGWEKEACDKVLDWFSRKPEAFGRSLASFESLWFYYEYYFQEAGKTVDYPAGDAPECRRLHYPDDVTLVSLLGMNRVVKERIKKDYVEHLMQSGDRKKQQTAETFRKCNTLYPIYLDTMNQAFKTAGEIFQVIDDGGKHSVVVLYDQIAKQSLRVVLNEDSAWSDRRLALRQLQPYTIALTDKQMEATFGQRWKASGQFVYVLPEECYTEELGYTSL